MTKIFSELKMVFTRYINKQIFPTSCEAGPRDNPECALMLLPIYNKVKYLTISTLQRIFELG